MLNLCRPPLLWSSATTTSRIILLPWSSASTQSLPAMASSNSVGRLARPAIVEPFFSARARAATYNTEPLQFYRACNETSCLVVVSLARAIYSWSNWIDSVFTSAGSQLEARSSGILTRACCFSHPGCPFVMELMNWIGSAFERLVRISLHWVFTISVLRG